MGTITKRKNSIKTIASIISTYIMSVSIGLNAVIIPLFMEQHPQDFNSAQMSIILAMESICAILLCLYFQRLVKIFGLKRMLILSALIRSGALILLGAITTVPAWFLGAFILGTGSFLYLIIIQTTINTIPINNFKGIIYSLFGTAIALGIATGPLLNSFIEKYSNDINQFITNYITTISFEYPQFTISALISVLALFPIAIVYRSLPQIKLQKIQRLYPIIKKNKDILFAVSLCGISFFGVSWYITLYGIRNEMSIFESSLLISSFMVGSICLDAPLVALTKYINRKTMLFIATFICTLVAIFLPLAIYNQYQAYSLLFIWGGFISAMYSISLLITDERHQKKDIVATNASFSLMENIGAAIGLVAIGLLINTIGTDGFSYVIMLSCIAYFTFVIVSYKIK